MSWRNRASRGAAAALMLLSGASAAEGKVFSAPAGAAGVKVPKALWGTWDLGPDPCTLPLQPDIDSPKRIDATSIRGYEDEEIPKTVRRISVDPAAWLIRTESDVAPEIVISDIYVLKGDHLTITDGQTTKRYRRCR